MALSWADQGGSTYANPELSNEARMISAKESRFFELTSPAGDLALGKNHGDSVACKLWGRISGTATTALNENQKVPMVFPPEYTVSATVYQRGIAVPFTGMREDLDRLDVESVVIASLREHSSRTHNALIQAELITGRSFTYVCTSTSAGTFLDTGSVVATAGANPTGFHLRDIARYMKKYNVPFADGKNFHAVFSPTAVVGLFNDATAVTGFVDVKKYSSEADGLLNGEIGTYFGIRIMEDNDAISDGIGTGSAFGSGFVCGLDAVREIPVYPMELRANLNLGSDFGRQKALAWLSLLGYKCVWNYTSHGQGTVLHITSA